MSTQFFKHLNGSIAYDDQGEGPPVVLAPSLGDLRAEYRFLIPHLVEAGCRVVSMDLRGMGESSVAWPDYSVAGVGADLVGLVRHLDAGPALLVGTSLAAGAAVWAAAEEPELVSGLVLIGPSVRDGMPLWQVRLLFGPLFSGPWGVPLWARYYRSLYPASPPADLDQYIAGLRRNLKEPGRLAAMRKMITASKAESETRLEQVAAPSLVLMGSRDPDFKDPAAEAHLIAGRLGGETRLVEGVGHYPHAERPEQAAAAILEFAEKTFPRERHVAAR